MKLNLVTVTGADDNTSIEEMFVIAKDFPFVEFGILLSRDSMGMVRFPSAAWLNELVHKVAEQKVAINLSGHLCGAWVRQALQGLWPEAELRPIQGIFKRWQINTHAIPHNIKWPEFESILRLLSHRGQSVIFQNDEVNTILIDNAISGEIANVATLFDVSHGAGVLPDKWPSPIPKIYCGYAGGLSPDNLVEQLGKIETAVGDGSTWIDAETLLRTDDIRSRFDLDRVVSFLRTAKPWVK